MFRKMLLEDVRVFKKLKERVDRLEIQAEVLGWAYITVPLSRYFFYTAPPATRPKVWAGILCVIETVEDNVKIRIKYLGDYREAWAKKEDCVFKDDVYSKLKKQIEKRYETKEDKKGA